MSGMRRSVPDDFAEIAPTLGMREAQRRWDAGTATINKFCRLTGVTLLDKTRTARPVPDDFAEIEALSIKEACARWGCSDEMIYRWMREAGVSYRREPRSGGSRPPRPTAPPPPDLASMAATTTIKDLCRAYGVGEVRMKRWLSEIGARKTRQDAASWGAPAPLPVPPADSSVAGRAAQFLRPWGSVYRADVLRPSAKGYVMFGRHVTADEMIAKAIEKGFDPHEWSMVA